MSAEKYQHGHVNDLSHYLTEPIKPGGDNLDCFDCSLLQYVVQQSVVSADKRQHTRDPSHPTQVHTQFVIPTGPPCHRLRPSVDKHVVSKQSTPGGFASEA